MQEADRTKILTNLVQLMQVQNVPEFHSELISRHIFTPDMLEAILAERRTPKEQIQKLFIEICKRGPNAFRNLVEALGRSGNIRQAQLLDRSYARQQVAADDVDDNENAAEEGVVGGGAGPALGHYRFQQQQRYHQQQHHQHQNHQQQHQQRHYRQHQQDPYDDPVPVHHHLEDPDNKYRINSIPKGYALIINVIDFDGNPSLKRIGAEYDSERLAASLQYLGYDVTVILNPKKKTLLCPHSGVLKKFTDKFSARPVDSCVVSLMSHGEDNFWFQTSDCESIGNDWAHLVHMWEDIFPRFNNQFFPMMRNKPKLFIIQCCRGERLHKRIQVTPVSTQIRRPSSIQYDSAPRPVRNFFENHPEFNHMMILQSTLPGYVSVRHELKGSPFIRILCEVFKKYGRQESLTEMIPVIAKKLQDLAPEEGGPQTCTFKTVGYVKKFSFGK